MTRLAVKEEQWVAAIGDLLDHHGWRWHDTWPTRRTPGRWTPEHAAKGVPDLVAIRPPRVVWIELKTETNTVQPAQAAWIDELQHSGQEVYVVRLPGDYHFLDEVLRPSPEQGTLTGNSTGATWTQSP
jgi:hypothetical protein